MRIFLNPGHDLWKDPGACGLGLKESDVVRDVCKLVDEYLTKAGVEVVGNLQDDDLALVCELANKSGADIFVSVHCNSAQSNYAMGTETFCFLKGTNSEMLAECIQDQIVDSLATFDRGVKTANFYVLMNTMMPAVLVELAFINNEEDNYLLRNCKEDFAKAIARGVTDYELEVFNK